MKKQNLTNILLNSLLNIDFILLKNHFFLQNLNSYNIIKLDKKLFLHILNPLNLLVSIKQFFRTIFFFKKKNSILNFFVQGIHQKAIIKSFVFLNELNFKFKIFFKFLVLKKYPVFQFLLMLKQQKYFQILNFSKIFLNKNFFLIQDINSVLTKNNFGFYKIISNISDYKKLIFVLILLKQF